MGKGIGRQIQIGLSKEAVRGTAETAVTYWLPVTEATVEDYVEKAVDDQVNGVIEETSGSSITKKAAKASVKMYAGDKSFPLLLVLALGAVSSGDNADSDASIKDHSITVSQSVQHPAATIFVDDPVGAADYKHALGCLDSLEIAAEPGKRVELSAAFRAKAAVTAGSLSPAKTAENLFLSSHVSIKIAATVAGLTGATAIAARNLKLSIKKNLEDEDTIGSTSQTDTLNRNLAIEGEFEATWSGDSDFKTAYLAGTAQAMRIDFLNGDVTIGNAAHPEVKMDFYKVTFEELTRPLKGNDVVKQTVKFKAHYSLADAKSVVVTATNAVASY